MKDYSLLRQNDPALYEAVIKEANRQKNKIELIASENFVSEAVMEANSTILTNKYAEGYPGKRYYGGCENVDLVETLAIERAKKLFGAGYANVQPHSGAQANMAVFFALLELGDTVLSMNLAHGGHLSHGSAVNMSGKYWNIVHYGVNEGDNVIDYDEVRRLALECKPKMILAGASAYPRIIDFKKFREIADEVGAYLMVDMAHIAGLVRDAIRFCVDRVAGRVPVIAGTGSNDTAYAIDLTRFACEVGADAMLLVTPYYNKATQKGLIESFRAIADASDKPCILYNVPSRTGCNLTPASAAILAEHPNIVAIKEACGNISQIAELAHLVGSHP